MMRVEMTGRTLLTPPGKHAFLEFAAVQAGSQFRGTVAAGQSGVLAVAAIVIGLIVIGLFFTAWWVARAFLKPRDVFNIPDMLICRLGFWRSAGGLLVTVMVGIHYHGISLTKNDTYIHWGLTLLVGIICALACIALFLTVSSSRRALLRRSSGPLLRMLLVSALILLVVPAVRASPRLKAILATDPRVTSPSVRDVFLVLAALWVACLAIASYYYAARYLYGAGEMHPLLDPAVTISTASALMIVGLLPGSADMPTSIYLILTISGWLTATALSIWEWQLIRRTYDEVTIRNVPVKGFGSVTGQQERVDEAQWHMAGQGYPQATYTSPREAIVAPGQRASGRGCLIAWLVGVGFLTFITVLSFALSFSGGTSNASSGAPIMGWAFLVLTVILALITLPFVIISISNRSKAGRNQPPL
jgi:hypothetical protein